LMSATASAAVSGIGPPVLLLASLAGLAIPYVLHRRRRAAPRSSAICSSALRALGAGTVLGIALLHCLPEAAAALGCAGLGGGDYPWAFLIVAAVAAASSLLEGVLVEAMGGACAAGPRCVVRRAAAAAHPGGTKAKAPPSHPDAGGRPDSAHVPDAAAAAAEAGAASLAAAPAAALPLTVASLRSHSHGSHDSPAPTFHAAAITVLEVGIGLHSLVVGFALGSSRTGCDALPLLAAFAVHQLLEGAAVGSCLADSSLSRRSVAAAAAVMALSAPAGAVAGLATRWSADHGGHAWLAVTGAADAVAAGLLLHVGLADLLACGPGGAPAQAGPSGGPPPTRAVRVAAHALFGASLIVGLALTAVLAVWG
jgi:zinc transporter ZupT